MDAQNYTRINTLSEFGTRIANASGKSLNIEFVSTKEKYGGNGVNMAAALASLGVKTDCIGAMGTKKIHPAFLPLNKRLDLHSYGEPSFTDAIEFVDGKVIASKLDNINELKWEKIIQHIGLQKLTDIMENADIIGLNNWTMVTAMTDIWEHLLNDCFPLISNKRRVLFFDLADPKEKG